MKKITVILLFAIFGLAAFLRIYNIANIPMGLYMDEASVAYNAYSILTTGKDEHGVAFPFAFQAFGEYKMPVFIYMTSASLALFGKNEFAIRIPSALFGTLTVILFYFFANEIIRYEQKLEERQQEGFALVSTFLLAISPWHIQFSRAGFEAIVALFFYLLGAYLFLLYYRKKKIYLSFFSFFFLVASMYTYNAFRVIGFASVILLALFLFIRFPKERRQTLLVSITAFLLALPMLVFSFTQAGQARFMQVETFSGSGQRSLFLYPLQYFTNYLSYFTLPFLFSYGDGIGRHLVFRMGPVFKWEVVFLGSSVYFFVKEKWSLFKSVVIFLLVVAPLAAALALPSPHILRSLLLVIPITLLVSYGIVNVWTAVKRKYIFLGIILLVACLEFVMYADFYYNFAPVTIADWGGQYKELIIKLARDSKPGEQIFINENVGMNPVYAKFYDPALKITIVSDAWTKPKNLAGKNVLYVSSSDEKRGNTYIHVYPHKLQDTDTTPDKYHTILYNIWKI